MLVQIAIAVIAALAAFTATSLVRRNAGRLGVVQAPNARSSHKVPTPSGGGVGIVLGGSIAVAVAAITAPLPYGLGLVLAAIVAGIGFYDDRRPISARIRLPAQLVLAGLALWLAVPLDSFARASGMPLPAIAVGLLGLVAMVYWINLFNFMDGIDGLAGSQAIFMCAGAALLSGGGDPHSMWVLLGLAAATLGFLVLNWPPAKIFMGDAGSTYLGYMIAFMAIVTVTAEELSLLQWAILGAAFIVDATVTLMRRLALRERVFEAHRRHAYQKLSRRWRSHRAVTLGFIGLNVVWLLPLAWLAGVAGWSWPALLAAYLPLVGAALYFGAGTPETEV